MKSLETNGSLVVSKMFFKYVFDACLNALFKASTVAGFFKTKVKSTNETVMVGTLMDNPSNFSTSSGIARVTAMAAPVVVGTIFCAAARARRKSLCEPSCRF